MKLKRLLLAIVFFMIPLTAAAEMPVWVEADGESRQGDLDTPREVQRRARQDARTKAVAEAVGTFVKAHTLVSNSQISEDLVYAAVRGKIVKELTLSYGWEGKERNIYRVRIKALVEPVYPEKGEGLSVKLHLSKTVLKEGDEVEIVYQVSQDAYVYIFSIAADGSVTLLFPNAHMKDHYVPKGETRIFPPQRGPVRLTAAFLPDYRDNSAEERIKIIATVKREPLIALGFREGVFQVFDARSTGMIDDLVRRLGQLDPEDWTEASATYTLKR